MTDLVSRHRLSPVLPFLIFPFLFGLALLLYWPTLGSTLLCDDYFLMGLSRDNIMPETALVDLSMFDWVLLANYPSMFRPLLEELNLQRAGIDSSAS